MRPSNWIIKNPGEDKMKKRMRVLDTTLRDGSQAEGVSFSVSDRLVIASKLDEFGVDYVEGGFPLSNPKEAEFFNELKKRRLKKAKPVAFGMTRRKDTSAKEDAGVASLIAAGTPAVTVVAKTWDLHVQAVLRTSLRESLNMIEDTVSHLKSHGLEVLFDAEHFFDGYRDNKEFALKALRVAAGAGADAVVLCDTNGGSLPAEIEVVVRDVASQFELPLGIHTHNDSGVAVAGSLAAVDAGATHVQGTINGFGERCGNADLTALIPNLVLKKGRTCRCGRNLAKLTELSRFVYEVANVSLQNNQPYVGESAFAHKSGLHADAVAKKTTTFEHVTPGLVGNERRFLVSELAGSSALLAKAERYKLLRDKDARRKVLKRIKELERDGYHFEAAEGSFELIARKLLGGYERFFEPLEYRVVVNRKGGEHETVTEASLKVRVGDAMEHVVSEGDGPVNALDNALRKALEPFFPELRNVRLIDYKVRVIDAVAGTAAKVRVIVQSKDHESTWGTVGVSENIIDASWEAILDSVEYKLIKERAERSRK